MSNTGKRLKAAREGVDREKAYALDEAVKVVKSRAKAKFDETVEVAMNLGVDPKHADQMVRGVCNLPNGSGRTQRVAVFAKGAKAEEAKAAGADVVGAEDLVEQVVQGHHQLRPLHRHARHDGSGGPARQGAGSARPDAEPARRHGDDGCHVGGQGRQGRCGRVPRREGRHRAGRRRQGELHARRRWWRTSRRSSTPW